MGRSRVGAPRHHRAVITEPPPEDDHWRTEALTRMERSGAVLDRIESNEPYPVEDNSDLAGDREQIPTCRSTLSPRDA